MFLVIAYDIVSDRRRNKLVKLLKDYGQRVNYSVFECELEKQSLPGLKKKVSEIINMKKDSILYYELCNACKEKRVSIGIKKFEKIEHIINV
jgi:CRISPR-associated protein Cas2